MLRRCPASPRTYAAPRSTPAPVRGPSALAARTPARPAPANVAKTIADRPATLAVFPRIPRMSFAKKATKEAATPTKGPAKEKQPMDENKGRALDAVLKEIEQSYGKGSMVRLGKNARDAHHEVISTGSIALDAAVGIGGLPRGRVTEIFGPESSGKTTLALHVIAAAQKAGGSATFIDAEHALDPVYAAKLGVDTENLFVCQPDTGEQALEIADSLVRSGTMDVIVVDSVAALVPKAELEGDMGQANVGGQARLMSQALRKITSSLAKSKTVFIFINQIRMKIGVMFGNPEVTSGGNALKFYSSVRLDIRRIGSLKKGEEISGNQVAVKVVKNKLAPPFRKVQMDIDFGHGISRTGELVDLGVQTGALGKSGAWYTYKGENFAQGREKAKQYFEANPTAAAEVEAKIREELMKEGNPVLAVEVAEEEEDEPEVLTQ